MKQYGENFKPRITVNRLADGLGVGDGSISLAARLTDNKEVTALTEEIVDAVEAAIVSPDIITPIEADDDGRPVEDDGCGDGRFVKHVYKGEQSLKRSLNRAKVFGGGVTMAVAGLIGTGKDTRDKLVELFESGRNLLRSRHIDYGAHTDEHAHGPNCGCGAIDKAPLIIRSAVTYRHSISEAISALTDDTEELDTVLERYAAYDAEVEKQEKAGVQYQGKAVMRDLQEDKNVVVKELGGPHLETHIVVNTVPGYTVNQELIRQISAGKAQVFGVDEWRIRQIADTAFDSPAARRQAYLSMLVYTLATAAVLTKGDLPVYVVAQEPQLVAA